MGMKLLRKLVQTKEPDNLLAWYTHKVCRASFALEAGGIRHTIFTGSIPVQRSMIKNLFVFLILLVPSICFAQTSEDEWTKFIVEQYPERFEIGNTIWDQTRPDMYYKASGMRFPVEVDWADRKWMEAYAQSAWYAEALDSRPVIVLLVKDIYKERDDLMRVRLLHNSMKFKDMTWIIFLYDCKNKTLLDW